MKLVQNMNEIIYGALAIPYKIENNEFKFLLLKHKKGFWTFPGGAKEEQDKTLEDTLIREIREEIGLSFNSKSLKNTHLVNHFIYDNNKPERAGKNGETHFYLLELTGDEILSSWDNIIEHGWFTKDQILDLLPYSDEKKIFQEVSSHLE